MEMANWKSFRLAKWPGRNWNSIQISLIQAVSLKVYTWKKSLKEAVNREILVSEKSDRITPNAEYHL